MAGNSVSAPCLIGLTYSAMIDGMWWLGRSVIGWRIERSVLPQIETRSSLSSYPTLVERGACRVAWSGGAHRTETRPLLLVADIMMKMNADREQVARLCQGFKVASLMVRDIGHRFMIRAAVQQGDALLQRMFQ